MEAYRPPPSSVVVANALVVIDAGIESVNVKNRYQGARVSARRANREPEDGIRWKFVHAWSSSCGQIVRDKMVGVISRGRCMELCDARGCRFVRTTSKIA